jgi:hypothetical protein
LQIDDRQRAQGVVGIGNADRPVCRTRERPYPEVLAAQVQQRAVYHIGERQRRAIERVSRSDAVNHECDTGTPANLASHGIECGDRYMPPAQ